MNRKRLTDEQRKINYRVIQKRYYDKHGPHKHSKVTSEQQREHHLKHSYGITIGDYNKMFNEQHGRCAICGKHQSECWRGFCIDHDHITGKVRGLLCDNCNHALGQVKDNTEILKNMVKYLENSRI